MFGSDKSVKLIDFGFAAFDQNLDPKAKVEGTPLYLSPEAITGVYGRESDIWALGVTLVQLLDDDKVPFKADTLEELQTKITSCDFIMPPHITPSC